MPPRTTRVSRRTLALIAVWSASAVLGAPLATASEARDWLARMNQALAERTYDGTFFHSRGGRTESLRILHRVRDGEVCERLSSLDGSGREFSRCGEEVRYVLPDEGLVLVERRPREGRLLPTFPRLDERTAGLYDAGEVQTVRLMERETRRVTLRPLDPYRYGYRVWIDARTYLPIKTEMLDSTEKVLEQIVFVNLRLMRDLPDEFFRVKTAPNLRWVRANSPPRFAGSIAQWSTRGLPRGFELTQHVEQQLPGADSPVTHLVFSDGLASVSVFIGARMPPRVAKEFARERQIGASTTFATLVDGHQVVVVGEVPLRTARLIASQIRARELTGGAAR